MALQYHFVDQAAAETACDDFYRNAYSNLCNRLFASEPPVAMANNGASVVGHVDVALFAWDSQSCSWVATGQNVTDGTALWIGQCLEADSIALEFTQAEIGELSGYILLSWVVGYAGGFLTKSLTKAVEMI